MNKKEYICGDVKVVEREDNSWGVINLNGEIIVPFGKYDWIERFDEETGYARVKVGKEPFSCSINGNKWGIINMLGEEVVPVVYDSVWKFLDKDREDTMLEKDGEKFHFNFFNEEITRHIEYDDFGFADEDESDFDFYDDEPGWGSYEKYGGYNGFDDYTIDTAFDGEPEATWNID